MRSGTSPREPYEIANFDPIHARVTTPVFPISIFVDLSRSTTRHAIGVSLFLLPFFFLFLLVFVHSFWESETTTSVSLFGTMTWACAGTGIAGACLVFTFRGCTFSFSSCNRDAPACFVAICQRRIAPCLLKVKTRTPKVQV